MNYKNRENEPIETICGKKLWHSRSCAVCVTLIIDGKVLVGKRGDHLFEGGKWSLPCGYLDWDEDIYEAASRELFEEMGVFVNPKLFKVAKMHVNSNPKKDPLQNVTFHFVLSLDILRGVKVNIDNKEVVDWRWYHPHGKEELNFAFNHEERIAQFIKDRS